MSSGRGKELLRAPSWQEVAENYRAVAERRDPEARILHPEVLRLAGRLRGRRVLEVGCGAGALSRALGRRGASVLGTDLDPRALEQAAADAREAQVDPLPQFELVDPRARRALPRGPFDLVIALRELANSEAPAPLLRELTRVLRPGGRLLVALPHPYRKEPASGRSLEASFTQLREVGLRVVALTEPADDEAPEAAFVVFLAERPRARRKNRGTSG